MERLEDLFDWESLFDAAKEDGVLLQAENCPIESGCFSAASIRAEVVDHFHDAFCIDRIILGVNKSDSVSIGILIFCKLFHPSDSAIILETGASSVRRIIIEFTTPEEGHSGLVQKPISFGYWPEDPEEFPFEEHAPAEQLPSVRYRMGSDELLTKAELSKRDTLVLSGEATGLAELGALFLNLGLRGTAGDRITLECDAGWRGVAPGSHELSLVLCGSPTPDRGRSSP